MRHFLLFGLLLATLFGPARASAALATGTALRATFVAMAEDSTRWGAQAARAALNQYAGTNYQDIFEDGEDLGLGARLKTPTALTSAAKVKPAAFLLLAPNPSTGHVRVGYSLPQTAKAVELRVYDEWGQPAGTYALTDEALAAGVMLRLRDGIYHCVLLADGAVVAKERLLITAK